ncbi:hypothetical protein DKX38_016068 [Salix brachista]|uniref:Uncharacterized protein n=1 Tax=Salix brachista TaxID=2182728 RepID=A0A5N5L712_9ROSI|nr:hypothetical protein DKX38_016068 [Salix brachista]
MQRLMCDGYGPQCSSLSLSFLEIMELKLKRILFIQTLPNKREDRRREILQAGLKVRTFLQYLHEQVEQSSRAMTRIHIPPSTTIIFSTSHRCHVRTSTHQWRDQGEANLSS